MSFIKINISTFSEIKLYLFSTVLFATLKIRSEKNRGTGLLPAKSTGTGPNSTGTRTGPEFRSGPSPYQKQTAAPVAIEKVSTISAGDFCALFNGNWSSCIINHSFSADCITYILGLSRIWFEPYEMIKAWSLVAPVYTTRDISQCLSNMSSSLLASAETTTSFTMVNDTPSTGNAMVQTEWRSPTGSGCKARFFLRDQRVNAALSTTKETSKQDSQCT